MIELAVVGIRLDQRTPVLLLQERGGTRLLPIWISSVEAAAIAVALEEETFPRPLTHDLLAEVLSLLAQPDDPVITITDMADGVYLAQISLGDRSLDARPSDAVAVAVRRGWLVQCPVALMNQVGVNPDDDGIDEVEQFREFLDSVQPEDF